MLDQTKPKEKARKGPTMRSSACRFQVEWIPINSLRTLDYILAIKTPDAVTRFITAYRVSVMSFNKKQNMYRVRLGKSVVYKIPADARVLKGIMTWDLY
jgi:hypothetical protein